MALLPILRYPDPRLHTVAKPVLAVDARMRALIVDMLETMYDAQGIGLAATQVNVHERVVVIDVSEERNQPLVLINHGVERAVAVRVTAIDGEGQSRAIEADGMLAVCIQHEMDHLLGKVFVEYLSPLKRNRIKSKLLKQLKEERA